MSIAGCLRFTLQRASPPGSQNLHAIDIADTMSIAGCLGFSRLLSWNSCVLIKRTLQRASPPGSRNFCDYVTKDELTIVMESIRGELKGVREDLDKQVASARADVEVVVMESIRGELKGVREDLDKQVASARADVEVWGTPLIHIAAGEIVVFLMGHSERRNKSVSLEGSNHFRYPGIVIAASRCNINFDQFRRACDRSRVDRNRSAHAFDIEDLTLKVGHAQDIFERYPNMAKKTPHEHLLISNFNTIKVILEELHADGDRHYG